MIALVVDDEKLAVENMCGKLQKTDRITETHGFTDTDEALEYVRQSIVDVAFLDIKMQQMQGLTLAAKMRELRPDCAVIFVTGYAEYAVDAFHMHVEGYLLKPVKPEDIERELDHLERGFAQHATAKRVRIQCFGNFEIFVDGLPLRFVRVQTKELLALLVDRRGAVMNTEQLCAALWEDDSDMEAQKGKLRHLISDLTHTLKEANAENIFFKRRNSFAVVENNIDCDYFDFLHGLPSGVNAYSGEYMSQYSWAEMTLAALE